MDLPAKPTIMCLVCWFNKDVGPSGGSPERERDTVTGKYPKLVTLEEAAELAHTGAMVIPDPESMEEFAKWEGLKRSLEPKRKWFERDP